MTTLFKLLRRHQHTLQLLMMTRQGVASAKTIVAVLLWVLLTLGGWKFRFSLILFDTLIWFDLIFFLFPWSCWCSGTGFVVNVTVKRGSPLNSSAPGTEAIAAAMAKWYLNHTSLNSSRLLIVSVLNSTAGADSSEKLHQQVPLSSHAWIVYVWF